MRLIRFKNRTVSKLCQLVFLATCISVIGAIFLCASEYFEFRNNTIDDDGFLSLERVFTTREPEVGFIDPCNNSLAPRKQVQPPDDNDNSSWDGVWSLPDAPDIFILRAYWDTRADTSYVRSLAMITGHTNRSLSCYTWADGDPSVAYVAQANLRELWGASWDSSRGPRAYRPFLISCVVPRGGVPVRISFTDNDEETCDPKVPSIVHVVHHPPSNNTPPIDFCVCVKGLDLESDESVRLTEWIELNTIIGAGKIVIYKYDVHPNVDKVLRYYEQSKIIDVIPLTLPGCQPNHPPQRRKFHRRSIWQKRRNELISYNDCLYRCLYRCRFVIPIDIDEVFVPVRHRSWKELMDAIVRKSPNVLREYSSLSVRNTYFLNNLTTPEILLNAGGATIPNYLHTLRHIVRTFPVSATGVSGKSFVNTNNTLTVFNHYALESLGEDVSQVKHLSPSLVRMHHYRTSCTDCPIGHRRHHGTRRDQLLWKYRDILEQRVNASLLQLGLLN